MGRWCARCPTISALLESSGFDSNCGCFATKYDFRGVRGEAGDPHRVQHDGGVFCLCGKRARQRVCPATQEPRALVFLGPRHRSCRIIPTRCSHPPPRRRRIYLPSFAKSSMPRNGSSSSSRLTSCRGEAGRGVPGKRAPARSAGGRDHQFAGFHGWSSDPFQVPALPQTAAPGRRRTLRNQADRGRATRTATGQLPRTERIGYVGLHAKTFAFDRRIGFIGSYNLDPRSSKLNTEMGALFDCPSLAKRLPETTERDLDRNAYRVELAGGRLVWVTSEGDKQVRYNSEPEAGLWKRIKAQVLSWLPIENLL